MTDPIVAHAQRRGQVPDRACRVGTSGSSTTSMSRGRTCPHFVESLRRACPFLITGSATISPMTTCPHGDASRVPVLVRLQVPNRDGLRSRATSERASMSGYLESLIRRDLDESERVPFVAVKPQTFTSRGKNGTGRPTKGARATVMLRIEPSLREQIHQRAHSLQLTVIDYFESLVSQDISAAATTEGVTRLDQTA